jgi:hypothetical protein
MSDRASAFIGILAALLVLSPAYWSKAVASDGWQERDYNPRPQPDDLTLPMPCGGGMVFRRIEVGTAGRWFGDKKIELGLNRLDKLLGYKEDRWITYISGTFSDGSDPESSRYYYMAKYETTELQYRTFEENCPRPSMRNRLPAVDVSWFDAVNFARTYTEWLLEHTRDLLPKEEETFGYLRLPTETEWEFAARGGLKVDQSEFAATLFPMPDGELEDYVWYFSTQSAGGDLQPIGLRKPNPLGLHDIIGNASEMVFEPFRLSRRGRLHGQAGGFVSKGGNVLTSAGELRTALRFEHPYFDARSGRAARDKQMGFRLVLTAPVIVSSDRLEGIRAQWEQLPAADQAMNAAAGEREAFAALAALSQRTEDEQIRTTLEAALRDLEQANAERNELRDRAVRALIGQGAFLAHKIRLDQRRVEVVEQALAAYVRELDSVRERLAPEQLRANEEELERLRERQERLQADVGATITAYGDVVITIAQDYSQELIASQLNAARVEIAARDIGYMIRYAEQFVTHVAQHQQRSGGIEDWVEEIVR